MKSKTVQDIMTPLQSVFMLSHDDIIGHVNMEKVRNSQY
jgi:CBS domain containing-hemolysin-like protein